MKKILSFFSSIHFKIALTFVLMFVIFIEIVGAIFIRELENSTVETFKTNMNSQAETIATNLSIEMSDGDGVNDTELKRIIMDFSKNDIIEIRVLDEKGLVRATTDVTQQSIVGKKNDLNLLNDYIVKRQTAVDASGSRVYINVQPIYSPTGETMIGLVYMTSDLESKYSQVNDTAFIFLGASLIAMGICLVIAFFVSRTITKPIGEMQQQARKIANGEYSSKLVVYGNDELGQLGETFNELSERIEEAQEILESERHRLDSVLTHMTDGVLATDRRGRVVIINDMASMLLNVETEEVVGISILELLGIDEQYTFRELMENQSEITISVTDADDNLALLSANFSMIRRESGFITGLVCVLHDITEQEKDERERRDFVSNVSHELRTPLTSLNSYLEALTEGAWQDPDLAPAFLKVTQDETERMIRMIHDLLELSKMDSNSLEMQMELVNLNEMLRFILDRFDMMVKNDTAKSYTIKREFTKRSIWIEADSDKLMQVFDNILNNAIKYSPQGGEITVRLFETHNSAVVSVTDQGLGIPKKDINKVFERFYRVDKARSRSMGGSGLGLAISKEVVKQHGGNLWVESDEGKGSTFFVSLPYEPYEEDLWE